jgi:hypothetical protein
VPAILIETSRRPSNGGSSRAWPRIGLVASGIRSGDPVGDPAKETKITRPLCAYPKTAQYKGSGSTDDAANFSCAMPRS